MRGNTFKVISRSVTPHLLRGLRQIQINDTKPPTKHDFKISLVSHQALQMVVFADDPGANH